ncbi:MAG TPA: serine hydrolase [Acidimicrobiales bacterium]|jgi:CubicO group peptidase (beta-lactamase class C family)|nr:serine hydrolase [Acidimicrobiales bacterium]
MSGAHRLVPLPRQPDGVPWPGADPQAWPTGERIPAVDDLVEALVGDTDRYGTTYAVVVARGGQIVRDHYGGELPSFEHPPTPVTASTPLLSWSMAKSILHAAVGVLVGDGRLQLDEPANVPAWHDKPDDPRAAITLEHLLAMRDGLAFAEDYVDAGVSDVIEMLFGSGGDDVAGYAESRPAAHPPEAVFNYSSGTSNIVSAIAARAAGSRPTLIELLRRRVFEPIGMHSADPRVDAAGTFIGSSYVYATARDYARFGLLYLRDGVWDGERVLPEGWVDHGRRQRSVDGEGNPYGAHWWVVGDDVGSFRASGYEGQSILVSPGLDLIAVRLGSSTAEMYPALGQWRATLVDSVR